LSWIICKMSKHYFDTKKDSSVQKFLRSPFSRAAGGRKVPKELYNLRIFQKATNRSVCEG
jgi:hypothetical protein